jgi:hypothetical protein
MNAVIIIIPITSTTGLGEQEKDGGNIYCCFIQDKQKKMIF